MVIYNCICENRVTLIFQSSDNPNMAYCKYLYAVFFYILFFIFNFLFYYLLVVLYFIFEYFRRHLGIVGSGVGWMSICLVLVDMVYVSYALQLLVKKDFIIAHSKRVSMREVVVSSNGLIK
ncbi:hypothetical protein GIB67_022130 [Kingdonia uniflora]|uniref:Uncharacterized protein n=1 Tax=Kingdonia uniflora TaxID=39325 RepID=A0A7J7N8T8_9MAGN|nr:hypothetical protein GIB67_022130 [Kingdonia uniflora]